MLTHFYTLNVIYSHNDTIKMMIYHNIKVWNLCCSHQKAILCADALHVSVCILKECAIMTQLYTDTWQVTHYWPWPHLARGPPSGRSPPVPPWLHPGCTLGTHIPHIELSEGGGWKQSCSTLLVWMSFGRFSLPKACVYLLLWTWKRFCVEVFYAAYINFYSFIHLSLLIWRQKESHGFHGNLSVQMQMQKITYICTLKTM